MAGPAEPGDRGVEAVDGRRAAAIGTLLRRRQASEQYLTSSQFLPQAWRHTTSQPQATQGLCGKACLLPLKPLLGCMMLASVAVEPGTMPGGGQAVQGPVESDGRMDGNETGAAACILARPAVGQQ